ncbi:hemocyte protein-glutamine gamma-glutamyltransferase-like [Homalodisca vitripennis]|uniref:hemocyte protein-glutamine gamma-glutamyltransferase-like n=1 Tax=Homalodisca vitripennis TaxID=197043 RepID=UPI001EEC9940|nr:hemocyte protein-glutamine gamma-glutamyltransferase-like [Homalodisca vitripennis]
MSYWVSCRKAAKNYKEELQKRFCANYSSDVSNTRSIISKEIFDNNIIDSSSPILQVQNVSFDREVEGFRHHTSRYEVMQEEGAALVFRRGQPFSFVLHFNRAFIPEEDYFHLQAEFGHTPLIPKGTKYKLPLSEKSDNDDNWEFSPVNQSNDENEFKVQVKTPSNCQVGLWKFALFTYKRNSPGEAKYTFLQDFYILFNPWNESDQVFLEDEEKRQEYVLNDHGKIWMGTNKAPVSYPWVYGQFDLCVLPVVTLLLAGSDIPPTERGSAVIISRALSALVNSYDDEGLLVGKWVGTFDDGTKPFSWTGSIDFFNEFLTSSRSVKYAQCWVFAGALATACRTLGIPCRPVTCYVCAHDTDNSLTVDKYFSKSGKVIKGGADGGCHDSIWNFHCWNDVWMTRPDLPPGYDGWQAIDATPQEKSGWKYRTGPASLEAIKKGLVGYQYDTSFLFSEVNADVCHFVEDDDSPWRFTRIKLDPSMIGKRIVTQSLTDNVYGERGMEDITSQYKNSEGSEAERAAVFNAIRAHPKAQKLYKAVKTPVVRDVYFKLKEIDSVLIGDTFSVSLTMENHASEQRKVNAALTASSVFYTGQIVDIIKEGDVEVNLQPKEVKTVRISVLPEDYHGMLAKSTFMKVMAVANVVETGQSFTGEDDFEVLRTKLEIKVLDQIHVGNTVEVQFFFSNPLVENLTNCELKVEGPGLLKPRTEKVSNIPSYGQLRHSVSMTPRRVGTHLLVATLSSDQLSNIKGSKHVMVEAQN